MLHAGAGLVEDALVGADHPFQIGAKQHGANFKNHLIDIGVAIDFAGGAGLVQGLGEGLDPMGLNLHDTVAGGAGLGGELGGDGGEEAAAGEDPLLQMVQKRFNGTVSRASPWSDSGTGSSTSRVKISAAVSMVASSSSSLDLKWA